MNNSEIEELIETARSLGATFHVDGGRVKVVAPKPLPQELIAKLRAKRAAVLSHLALPDELHPVVRWAAWLVEHVPEDEVRVCFNETPLRPVTLRLTSVGRYVSETLTHLNWLRSWGGSGNKDWGPGWTVSQMQELCQGLKALREALRPFGLGDIKKVCP